MKFFLSLSLVLIGGVYNYLGAQTLAPLDVEMLRSDFKSKQVISPAPEAAELGKYGNTPMNLSTGTPNISIPLYELKGNSLSLPISLNFSATGFNPQESPTWVGQNWSLNAGGVITRSVRGNPDDDHYFGQTLELPPSSDLFALYDVLKDIKHGVREREPDIYFYNFTGHTGKFVITPAYEIAVKERNMMVMHTGPGLPTISIIDESGNRFEFTDKEATRMVLGDDEEPDPATTRYYNYTSSWYLSNITSADGHEKMIFEYYYTGESQIDLNSPGSRGISRSYTSSYNVSTHQTVTNISGSIYGSTGPFTYARRKYLKKITFTRDNNTIAYVDLISDTNRDDAEFSEARVLRGIKVYAVTGQGEDQLVTQFNMGYGYYTNPANTYTKKRLRLDSLQEIPVVAGTTAPPPYKFEYYSDAPMPEKFSKGLDHWGFYNESGNISLVPSIKIEPSINPSDNMIGEGADREPRLDGSAFGMLSKMSYPTGGYTTFEYELHDSRNSDGTTRILGGVRIKKIIDYAGNGQAATAKVYSYRLGNNQSSGVSDNLYPVYLNRSSFTNREPYPLEGSYLLGSSSYSISGNAIYGLGTFQGGHVGYSMVTESVTNLAGTQLLGKTVYEYHMDRPSNYDENVANGDLIRTSVYDNTGKLQYQQENEYAYNQLGIINCTQVKPASAQTSLTKYCKTIDANGFPEYERYTTSANFPDDCVEEKSYGMELYANYYGFALESKSLVKQTVKTYDQLSNSYILTSTKNSYDNPAHIYPTKIEQYSGDNDVVITRKKYVADYPYTSAVSNDGGIHYLDQANIKGAEIESYQYRQDASGQNSRIIGGSITNYGSDLQPTDVYSLETANPLTAFNESVLTSSAFTMDPHYKLLAHFKYSDGLLVEEQKDKDIVKSYIWNYNNSYPTAEVVNSPTTFTAYSSFESLTPVLRGWLMTNCTLNNSVAYTGSFSCNIPANGNISKLLSTAMPNEAIISCWLHGGSITLSVNTAVVTPVITGPVRRGWTYYEYHLPAGAQQINITSNNAVIDELRLYPADAQMSTYTYKPLVGQTSKSSPENMTTLYEYDGLNRLVNIRDENNNIRQNIGYNYGPGGMVVAPPQTLFYSNKAQQQFTKNDCTQGEPTQETYVVPYGKYGSAISQADADSKAQQDIQANGQAYANSIGQCLFYNTEVSKRFIKNDCPPGGGLGQFVIYVVPARKHSTPISQAEADLMAQQDIDDNGQAYANQHGTCACSEEGYKMVNGTCELGLKMYQSSVLQPNGSYLCTYRYEFSDGSYSITYSTISDTACPIL